MNKSYISLFFCIDNDKAYNDSDNKLNFNDIINGVKLSDSQPINHTPGADISLSNEYIRINFLSYEDLVNNFREKYTRINGHTCPETCCLFGHLLRCDVLCYPDELRRIIDYVTQEFDLDYIPLKTVTYNELEYDEIDLLPF